MIEILKIYTGLNGNVICIENDLTHVTITPDEADELIEQLKVISGHY